ncbi:MAG: PSD1 and planctomycete cytochrome C domain-containing protein [Bryobacteraceae bacterium]|nr:PSD1 and planctomycete cytochrome C domain-containing protein [Bryobacteraceae bacterium]
MSPIIALLLTFAADSPTLPPPAATEIDFARDVAPVLKRNCQGCHGAAMQQSGFRLDDGVAALKGGYGGAVILPGKSAESPLVHRVAGVKGVPVMPPAGRRLTAIEVGILRAWIDQGAKFPAVTLSEAKRPKLNHWAFEPITAPALPPVKNSAWVRSPMDAFVLAKLEGKKIAPSPEADRRTLLRRLSWDLVGLPPTVEDIAAFQADTRPDAYERQVDRLLALPQFGEKWARGWLDQARYADSDGYEKDWVRPYAFRWRDWVINAINQDLPFNRFTIEQLAGDLLPSPTVEQRVATGFARNTLTNREGGIDDAQFRFESTLDRANTVSTVFLGLSMGCAQCHDHKYDPISQRDYYSLFAFFDNAEEVDIDAPRAGELGPWLKGRAEYQAKREKILAEYKVAELQAAWEKDILYTIAHPGERTDWDLAWDCVNKLTEGGDGGKIVRIPLEKRTPRERDILTDHFVKNYAFAVGNKRYKELKFDVATKQLAQLKVDYPQLTQAMVIAENAQRHPTYLRVRGDYKTNGIEVAPTTPAVLPALAKTGPLTRLDLAEWLVSDENPLTARVAANRIWQELFGTGLVKTSDDFGTRADKPEYPELLTWLADDFRRHGWSRKQLIRGIVLSATYRQASLARPELHEIDPENQLLARQVRLRLTAEQIRDGALAASGLLAKTIGGPSIRPPMPAGVMELSYASRGWGEAWKVSEGEDRYRRGLYIQFLRTSPYPQLMTFDAPKSTAAQCKRDRSNTPLQALNLLNDPVFVEAAQALAVAAVTQPADQRLEWAYRRALGRAPSARESARMSAYFTEQQRLLADDAKAQAALAPYVPPSATRLETATWTGMASVLLNLEEFITRE